jgi:2-polyprenyl-6-methoxyphenol hydroxylase-like FAD-dependent oxidoreductase
MDRSAKISVSADCNSQKGNCMSTTDKDIVIVGGGPVGLYLAGRLLQQGFSCTVLEKKPEIDRHSKSLGIHPVSLELFQKAGIVDDFLNQGIKIEKGIAFWNREKTGEITFEQCPGPFRYIIALPQWQTEKILQDWVQTSSPETVIRNAEVAGIRQYKDSVQITISHEEKEETLRAKFVVGCDGKNSAVRRSVGIRFDGEPYPDKYIMGDFSDNTGFGKHAAVFLHNRGLIESFPLPNGFRRWVVKTGTRVEQPDKQLLAGIVNDRIGHPLYETENVMMSSFGVEHFLARTMNRGRVLLAGDAAHVVSPIGGQGMNLGWMGAELCSIALKKALQNPGFHQRLFDVYTSKLRAIAKQTARRAEINMWLGRAENSGKAVELGVRFLTKPPASHLLARLFTMRGLGRWWV